MQIDNIYIMRYTTDLMKKLITVIAVLVFLSLPKAVFAEDATICTQSYGGGVVCGVHTPVNTGIADNIPLIASSLIGAGGLLAYFSKKGKRV